MQGIELGYPQNRSLVAPWFDDLPRERQLINDHTIERASDRAQVEKTALLLMLKLGKLTILHRHF
ncbi:hypothetical protein SAMN04244573_03276 [Azotobacter beijerinckii]|uniref:Uncharacterized protein n=1 Tax=Azotobacter beijerinckii TaxID=170623 RepID=A0A1H9MY99_9GAMM|nr:hypothetical protein SAMN04244573_03276 [Azotobacter beijerinckii]